MNNKLRNIAIIAHVDHGKTTLLDKLLQQSGVFQKHEEKLERIMDSNELEKERGITILAKNTSVVWKGYRINIIDTPGHADFGGEVERVMSMVDSVLLVVDALDGPMPQTRFVTQKAFNNKIKPIIVINKIDRKNSRPNWVLDQIFELFINLDASDEQLDFPVVYTSALLGIAGTDLNNMKKDMSPLFESIIKYVPAPIKSSNTYFQMQISQIDYDNYLGVIGIGRIRSGKVKNNQKVVIIDINNKVRIGKINKLLGYFGLKRKEIESAESGDIIAITGLDELNISNTICDPEKIIPMPKLKIDEPTVKMFFCINTSPFCGKEGTNITSRQILARLYKETKYNVALQVEETIDANVFCVSGRGELHLSILIENMRREGYELEVSRPKVIFKKVKDVEYEPFESLVVDIEEKHQGTFMKRMGEKKGELKNIVPDNQGRVKLEYIVSSRSLIGFRTEFMNITCGTGLFHSSFEKYKTVTSKTNIQRRNGVLIANKTGKATAFSLFNLQDRGKLFIQHGDIVYEGQIIGIHNRSNDLTVNCLTGKKLTNMRASGSDEAITLVTPIKITLEQALSFINDDELVEITPKSIRLRKKDLSESTRKQAFRKKLK